MNDIRKLRRYPIPNRVRCSKCGALTIWHDPRLEDGMLWYQCPCCGVVEEKRKKS
jgi:hypothetical protein